MFKNQSYKPVKIIDGYVLKKQLHRGYKIVEYSHYSDGGSQKKRTLYKNLNLSDAESLLFKLESKL